MSSRIGPKFIPFPSGCEGKSVPALVEELPRVRIVNQGEMQRVLGLLEWMGATIAAMPSFGCGFSGKQEKVAILRRYRKHYKSLKAYENCDGFHHNVTTNAVSACARLFQLAHHRFADSWYWEESLEDEDEYVVACFELWLRDNRYRFAYPPTIVERKRGRARMVFEGITPRISGSAHNGEVDVQVEHEGECWDLICCCEFFEGRTPGGQYYCSSCEPAARKLYPTLPDLLAGHVFEEQLLAYCNEMFVPGNWLVLFGEVGGSRAARIIRPEEFERHTAGECFMSAEPVVVGDSQVSNSPRER